MELIKLSYRNVDLRNFVNFWCDFYKDKQKNLYLRIREKEFSKEDLSKLFEWKNGGKISKKKRKILKKIIKKLNIINGLKTNFHLDVFRKEFEFIDGRIWKIFLLHIICQKEYPIFDQHVYRAFHFLTHHEIKEIPVRNQEKEHLYLHEYVRFFNELSRKSNIPRKRLDEALWAFGKFLKTPYAKF